MVNIVGPFGAGVNPSTTRPADPVPDGGADTWFVPCVDGDPNTGTKIPSVWLNKATALFRRAIRGMGVTEAATDDDMLLKAIQKADREIVNVGTGATVYKGLDGSGRQEMRSLKVGSGLDIDTSNPTEILLLYTAGGGGGGVADGDKGDITVTGTGAVWTVDNNVISNGKAADMPPYAYKMRLLSAAGDPQDIVASAITVDPAPALDRTVIHHHPGTGEQRVSSLAVLRRLLGASRQRAVFTTLPQNGYSAVATFYTDGYLPCFLVDIRKPYTGPSVPVFEVEINLGGTWYKYASVGGSGQLINGSIMVYPYPAGHYRLGGIALSQVTDGVLARRMVQGDIIYWLAGTADEITIPDTVQIRLKEVNVASLAVGAEIILTMVEGYSSPAVPLPVEGSSGP